MENNILVLVRESKKKGNRSWSFILNENTKLEGIKTFSCTPKFNSVSSSPSLSR